MALIFAAKRRKVEEPSARSAARRAFLDQLDLEAEQIKAGTHPLVPAALRRLKHEKSLRLAHAAHILAEREDELGRQMDSKVYALWRQWADSKDRVRMDLYLANHEKLKAIVEEEKTFPFLRDHPLLVNHRGLPPAPYYRAPVLEGDATFVPRRRFAAGHFLQPPPLDRALDHSSWEMSAQEVADDLALFAGYNPDSPYAAALPVAPVAVAVGAPVAPSAVPVPVQAPVAAVATLPPVSHSQVSQQLHSHARPPAGPDPRHAHLHAPQTQSGQLYPYPPPAGYYYDAPPPPPQGLQVGYPSHAYPPPPHGWHGQRHDDPYTRPSQPREERAPPPDQAPTPKTQAQAPASAAQAPRRAPAGEYDYAAEHRAKQDDISRRLHGKNAPKSAWANVPGGREGVAGGPAVGGGAAAGAGSASASAARAVGGGYGGAGEAKPGVLPRSASDPHGAQAGGTQARPVVGHTYGGYPPGEGGSRRAGGVGKAYGGVGVGVAYEPQGLGQEKGQGQGQVGVAPGVKSEAKPWSGDSLYGQPGPGGRAGVGGGGGGGVGAGAGGERGRYSYWG